MVQAMWRNLNKWKIAAVLAVLMTAMIIFLPGFAKADDVTINTDAVTGKLTHLDTSIIDFDTEFKLYFDGTIAWFIPKPHLKMNVIITLGSSADFDLDIKQGNLAAGTNIGSRITQDTRGITKWEYGESLLDNYPGFLGGIYPEVRSRLLIGATRPAKVKGSYTNTMRITIGTGGVDTEQTANMEFTSVEPKETNHETLVFVGNVFDGRIGCGEVHYGSVTIGPFMDVNIGFMSGRKAQATLHQDDWPTDSHAVVETHIDDNVNCIHSCLETGKPGCVQGQDRSVKEFYCDVTAKLRIPLIDYTVFSKTWHAKENYKNGSKQKFVQSLTWKEKLKHQEYCDHLFYKIPVRVWYDQAKTMPVEGVRVRELQENFHEYDSNMGPYVDSTTGWNPKIRENPAYIPYGKGRANIYLPYIDGQYTIRTDTSQADDESLRRLDGKSKMPTAMRRGANDPVDIVLGSREKTAYSVRKEWKTDYEGKDKPDEIEVLLQAQFYNTGFLKWETVMDLNHEPMVATLSAANNWQYTFPEVPRYEMTPKGDLKEIKYRIRELKPAAENRMNLEDDGPGLFDDDDAGVIQEGDGWVQPDRSEKGKALSARVVPSKFDLDNTHVWDTIKSQVTDWDQLWQIDTSTAYGKRMAKSAGLPTGTVEFDVPEYTTSVGERVPAHKTRYQVEYKEEDNETVITDTAVMDMALYKRWFLFGDEEEPDEVWLVLQYRVKEEYRNLVGGAENFTGLWLPVWKPLDGDVSSIFSAAGSITGIEILDYVDLLIAFDVPGLDNLKFAIAKVVKPEDYNFNKLVEWRARFRVKKYNWMGIDGIPVEYQAAELSSAVLTDVLKYLTGVDIPISFSLNPFSGQKYLTVPGKLLQVKPFDKDWERCANIINTWYSSDDDVDEDGTPLIIGGSKIWQGDTEADRPDTLDIVVKDTIDGSETEIGRVTIRKSDNQGRDTWVWALRQSDLNEAATNAQVKLDPDKTYTVSEEYPEGFANKNKYICKVNGHDITNTWADELRVVIRKTYDTDLIKDGTAGEQGLYPLSVEFAVSDPAGPITSTGNESVYKVDAYAAIDGKIVPFGYDNNDIILTLYDQGPYTNQIITDHAAVVNGLRNRDLEHLIVQEKTMALPDNSTVKFVGPSVSGPVISFDTAADGHRITNYTYTVTNHVRKTIKIDAVKLWYNDDPNNRVACIRAKLLRDGVGVKEYNTNNDIHLYFMPVGSNRWELSYIGTNSSDPQYELTSDYYENNIYNLPAYDDSGKPYEYTLVEDGYIPKGWTVNTNPSNWRSIDDTGFTPNMSGYTCTVSYTVKQDPTIKTRDIYQFTLRNTYHNDPETVTVKGTKTWDDDNNAGNTRPEKIRVNIGNNAQGILTSMDVTASDEWKWNVAEYTDSKNEKHTFPRFDEDGNELRYYITEGTPENEGQAGGEQVTPGVAHYSTIYHEGTYDADSKTWTCDITNSNALRNIPVIKEWDDNNDELQLRPEEVTIRLYRKDVHEVEETSDTEGTGSGDPAEAPAEDANESLEEMASLVLNEENGWHAIFTGIEVADEEGNEYVYEIQEDPIENYDSKLTGTYQTSFVVTNTPDPNLTNIPVTKEWEDDSGHEGDRPASVTVHLYTGDGENRKEVATARIYQRDDWKGYFRGVPRKNEDGTAVQYTVEEDPVSGYGAAKITGSPENGYTVKNPYTGTVSVTVEKKWEDLGAENVTHPESVSVTLYRQIEGGQKEQAGNSPYSITEADQWQITVTDLDKNDTRGNPYTYTVEETDIPNYKASYADLSSSEGVRIVITNTRQTRNLKVRKVWDDAEASHNPVTVRLYRNGTQVNENGEKTLSEVNNWEETFTDLTAYDDAGALVSYTVKEEPVPDGYVASVSGTMAEGFTITNTPGRSSSRNIAVTKVWTGEGNCEDNHPETVTVHLRADGKTVKSLDMKPDGNGQWTASFENVDTFAGNSGIAVSYTVTEDPVEGYTLKEISGTAAQGFVITNERDVYKAFQVTKIWENDETSQRPAEITLSLLKNGKVYPHVRIEKQPATADDNIWEYIITPDEQGAFPVYENGEEVVYTVEEAPVARYAATYSGNERDGFIIKNIRWRDSVDILVVKEWLNEGDHPDSLKVILLSDAGAEDEFSPVSEMVIDGSTDWKNSFRDQPVFTGDDRRIRYKVEEKVPEGYGSPFITRNTDYSFTIQNWKLPPTTVVVVDKEWVAEENSPIPERVTVNLLYNGAVIQSKEITRESTDLEGNPSDQEWRIYFTGLDRLDADGNEIQYEIQEEPVSGFETSVEKQEEEDKSLQHFIVTNARLVGEVTFEGTKSLEGRKMTPDDVFTFEILENGEVIATVPNDETGKIAYPTFSYTAADAGTHTYTVREKAYEAAYITTDDRTYTVTVKVEDKGDGTLTVNTENTKGLNFTNTYVPLRYTITYDPNGGTLDGSTKPVSISCVAGEKITIREAPVRSGYKFLYWKGSEYQPGDAYTVTEDHTFTAQWEEVKPTTPPSRGPSYDYKFSFTKKWSGGHESGMDWTLYNPDGTVAHKKFNKKIISDMEWHYEAWFPSDTDYYIVENVPAGYKVRYENVGVHANVTDRCYNGGTIINYKIPKTGDKTVNPILWIGCVLLGVMIAGGTLIIRKRRKGR